MRCRWPTRRRHVACPEARGLGLFRQDLPADVLLELFGGVLVAALKLIQHGQLGLEEASAAAASVFLDGARAR